MEIGRFVHTCAYVCVQELLWKQQYFNKRTALFEVVMQRVVVISHQHFVTTCGFHPQGSRIQKSACIMTHCIGKSVGSETSPLPPQRE
jgi:hypothetical protein